MIVAQQKPLEEIKGMIAEAGKVLFLGCGTCVTVCFAGGEKEVSILASQLRMASRMAGNDKEIVECTVQRQCEYEYNEIAADYVRDADLVVSLACGIGVQTMNEQFPEKLTVPGLNTSGLSQPTEQGVWEERCQACGDCVLALTGGLCPVARCAKSLQNGPCGGSQRGICEVYAERETPCVWDQIYNRLKALGQLDKLMEPWPSKNWHPSRDGGQRKIVREDLRL
jgi:ferredoxin